MMDMSTIGGFGSFKIKGRRRYVLFKCLIIYLLAHGQSVNRNPVLL